MTGLTEWFLAAGALLVLMALFGAAIERLPVSAAIVYLAFGYALGRDGVGLLDVELHSHLPIVRTIAEIGVVASLFSVGLRLGVPLNDAAWRVPLRLAGPGMVATIALVMLAAWALLGVGWGVALLLAAIVAPTDPVLASEVQIRHPSERDRVRFGLSAEGGLNDGLAAAGIALGLALVGHGPRLAEWFAWEVAWSLPAGLVIGWASGTLVVRLALALRRRGHAPEGVEVFLVLGLIALAYGVASAAQAEGFLAVFAAGVAARRLERRETGRVGTNPGAQQAAGAPAAMAHELLSFNRQFERIAEVVVVVLAGALLGTVEVDLRAFAFAAAVLIIARPLAVSLVLARERIPVRERRLLQWFGIRGIGSLYWLAFALESSPTAHADALAAATFAVIAVSIVAHGVSATPIMEWHQRRRRA